MKIAVMSDFHLGYNEDSFTQAREALEKASAFDLIIICGDLFDSRNPNQETIYEAVKMLAETKKKAQTTKNNSRRRGIPKRSNCHSRNS